MIDAGVSFQLEETHALPCLVFEPALDNSAFYKATEVKSKGSFKKIKAYLPTPIFFDMFLLCKHCENNLRLVSQLQAQRKIAPG